MTSRKRLRQLFTGKSPQNDGVSPSGVMPSSSQASSREARRASGRNRKRQHLLETLESRQMFAGPQLIGIQPNEGDLIVEGTVRNVAPRSLTFRFDEVQQIDPATFGGIQITRSGSDQTFGTADDVTVVPGLVTLGDIRQNEVVVRFAENLPDDNYRITVSAIDDPARGVVAVRNLAGEALSPAVPGSRSDTVNFELNLGALVESVVPQPVVRLANGTLQQRRDEILVYFNDDTLFVENDPVTGLPTARSAENPRFYQLLLTQETVQTTDDLLYYPTRVIYDEPTNTARLIFASDINHLSGVPLGGGTFRLRVGSAVDSRSELILAPSNFSVSPSVSSDLRIDPALEVTFRSKTVGENSSGKTVSFVNTGSAGLAASVSSAGNIVFNLGGSTPTVADLIAVASATPSVNALLSISTALNGVAGAGGALLVPTNIVSAPPLVMTAAGDTLTTSLDVGVFGASGAPITSLTIRESIDPQSFLIDLPGGTSDPGRLQLPELAGNGLLQTINENFGPDVTSGVTEISYNFQSVYETISGVSQLNQITELFKLRIREALSLWANYIGVQFRETANSGITFAVGNNGSLRSRPATQLTQQGVLNATLRIDPTFANSALLFDNQFSFRTSYGEDLFRKAMAGVGFLLGLEQSTDLTAQSLMSLNPAYLNATINPANQAALTDLEPSFPGNYDILHGQFIHRPDSNDVDLYRFEVNLGEGDRVGTFTAETFAERLADSSSLNTSLSLFKEVSASVVTDFEVGTALSVKITSTQPGALGNSSKIEYLRTDRAAGDTAIKIRRQFDSSGAVTPNGIVIDIPRRNAAVPSVAVSAVIDAINNDPFASTLFHAEIASGNATTDISGSSLLNSLSLSGGGIEQLARNDDYFSNDSLLRTSLANGVYYVGVAASGNNTYDPTVTASGFGGKTQGKYELLLKFEPQVNESDTIRDLDSVRVGVPGTALDGDGDGIPGGEKNFWFQTRPVERTLNITGDGAAIVPGQTFTIIGANGVERRFEFVAQVGTNPGVANPGNIAIGYNAGTAGGGTGVSTPSANLAAAIRSAIGSVSSVTGVVATVSGSVLTLAGERSIQVSSNFRGIELLGRTIFVDKTAGVTADGSQARPFNNISNPAVPNAFGATLKNDIVRIVGNGGSDNNPNTAADNFSYLIGTTETGGGTLEDGRNMQVPRGVTVMIDAGASFKLRNSAVSVGSTSLLADRSGGALQVLGTPRLIDVSSPVLNGTTVVDTGVTPRLVGGNPVSGDVVFTSTRDRSVSTAASGNSPAPSAGNWGGLIFRRDFDQTEGRSDLEDEGIFLQSVNHADIRFGGGSNITIETVQQAVNPIQMVNLRPTVTFNTITNSANAAMAASPDSFEETSYQAPRFQAADKFTADYDRVGPDIKNNRLVNNSINGLFIRVETTSALVPRPLTVAGRFDDIDIVHYIADNIFVAGTPGGSIEDGVRPNISAVASQVLAGGSLAAGTYDYRVTFVDAFGFESLASTPTTSLTVGANSSINLINLPSVVSSQGYIFRRIYRLGDDGVYRVAGQLDATTNRFIDDGGMTGSALDLSRVGIRGRLDGSLVIDPGTVVKFRGARIELGQGAQLIAEGTAALPIVFTSSLDDRYGTGGSFDTNNDNNTLNGAAVPARGDWSGIYASPTSNVSFDNAVIAYGGGVSLIEGGQSRGFAALELQQATARVTNSRFEYNANGQLGAGPVGRNGRLGITPSTIFARFTQPILVGNSFVDNRGSIIDLDSDSFGDNYNIDTGRQTGSIDRLADLDDNHGPLIRRNVTSSVASDIAANLQMNGLRVRGGILSTGSVWDDTDIAHVMTDSITVGDLLSNTGLRLMSRPDESLVIKLSGAGNPNSPTAGTGFTATGTASSLSDRIGGTIHVLGLPGAPVVFTSLQDDSVGAGRRLDGVQQTDTNGDTFGSRPFPNDWRSLYFDQFSNDRNLATIVEQELSTAVAPGLNATVANAQFLGELAQNVYSSDDRFRLGFEVYGFLSGPSDIDAYSFTGTAGTPIWIDIDKTSFTLDSVIEILDSNGNVLARSNNSYDEVADPSLLFETGDLLQGKVGPLGRFDAAYESLTSGGLYNDYASTNPRDAGLSFTLPGQVGAQSVYFMRVRSAALNASDAAGGLTRGGYSFQVRLQEAQEFPGSVVRFADIRYANQGIHLQGLPGSSPLLGEVAENESVDATAQFASNNDSVTGGTTLGVRPQYVGNLANTKTGTVSIAGALSNSSDIDFYQFDVGFTGALTNAQRSTVFDIDYADGFSRPDTNISVFYDDGSGPRLVLFGQNSNIAEDQSGPLNEEIIERLARGSVANGDAFVGPVSLRQGTYYVAVTDSSRLPTEFADNLLLRREPLDSVLRIFEDHIESIGGSTSLAPRNGSFVANASPGWAVTTNRSTDPGHQASSTFNGSRIAASLPNSSRPETEINNSFPTANSLETVPWSLAPDPNIGSIFTNTSQSVPHTTVTGTIGGEAVDIFSFDVVQPGSQIYIDIDNGFNPINPTALGSVDLKVQLFRENIDPTTGAVTRVLVRTDNDSPASYGGGGSQPGTVALPFSSFSADPFIQTIATIPGRYFVAVSPEATTYDAAAETFAIAAASIPAAGSNYTLHVSVQNHSFDGGNPNNQSYHFDRSTPTGTLESAPFDLTGYSAADLPQFYFSHYYNPEIGDNVVVQARSAEQPTPFILASSLPAATDTLTWRQQVLSLGQFAGDSGVVIEFVYQTTPGVSAAEGLFLDDFIVGFAERGEMITQASFNSTGFSPGVSSQAGEYQLEIRPGSEYATPINGGITLTDTFDTNDRQTRQVTLVAPAGNQINVGDRFTLNDGSTSLSFEFNSSGGFNSNVVVIPFLPTDSSTQIAQRIIDSINSSIVQASFKVKASPASSNQSLITTDARVNLHGNVTGDFLAIESVTDAPAVITATPRNGGGQDIVMPAILHDGTGDVNTIRAQGQVIIDSNRISDVRGVGIWSEPGIRPVDPRDAATNSFLVATPTGSAAGGAALNLPTLNDSVIGGLTPGVVITNNIVDQAGYAGIKIDGQTRPFIIEAPSDAFNLSQIDDGLTMVIDAAGTRVVFEFDDIGGGPTTAGGSGVTGGDGVADGHIPIYFRHASSAGLYGGRITPSTIQEVLVGMQQAINGSILVTNNLAGLVKSYVAASLFSGPITGGFLSTPTPALYVEGATGVYFSSAFQKVGGFGGLIARLAPIAEAPQPFARIVNNTIYGNDGREAEFFGLGTAEPNDTVSGAVDTKIGVSHSGTYSTSGFIGDNTNALAANRDVDLYKVELGAGDRLVVDIDTLETGPGTVLQVFNSRGVPQTFFTAGNLQQSTSLPGALPDYLNAGSTSNNSTADLAANGRDGFVDFTATEKGTYYVGVSSAGNDSYDIQSLSGRKDGTGGTGAYTLGIEVYAPQDFILSVDNNVPTLNGTNTGTRSADLIGTTFTITQIPDYVGTGAYGNVNADGNRVTFEFTNNAGGQVLGNGNINVPLITNQNNASDGGYRPQEIVRAIASAIGRIVNNVPALPNHALRNGPDGRSGPVGPVTAIALGGASGDNAGINKIGTGPIPSGSFGAGSSNDFRRLPGFGHNRLEVPNGGSVSTGGGLSDGAGTSELYALIQKAARIELSPEARAAGLRLTPDQATPGLATQADQVLAETGVLVTQGASPTVLNNVFVNLHQSMVSAETSFGGFGNQAFTNTFYKAQQVVVTGNTFQYDDPRNSQIRADINSPFNSNGNPGISTDAQTGPSNVNGAGTDFNIVAGNFADVLENPDADRFLPGQNSIIIDNAIDSLVEREAFAALKRSVGIPISNILAPARDNNGLLRAEDPNVANLGGIGQNVFKDRGALDRADFVGPVATLDGPRDNDAEAIDTDPTVSYLQLRSGTYQEFRILLQDNGDSSDPFIGTGIDDDTVVVTAIPGLRESGAAIALFEGDRLLTERVDYTFSYDTTKNVITLRPIAGIWRSDRAYRVAINNRDRIVGVAPASGQVLDGDSFVVTDSQGGRVTFEYDSGYQLRVPETLQFTVPSAGTGTGGIADGDLFSITGVGGIPVVFEFNRDVPKLPNTREVRFNLTDSPAMIAASARSAIAAARAAGLLDVDINVGATGPTVVIGSNAGTVLDTSRSGLTLAARTLALQVPTGGAGPAGVADGDVLTINDGNTTVSFEFEIQGGLNNAANTPIPIAGLAQADGVRDAILAAINASPLRLAPIAVGNDLFLGLPVDGIATVSRGNLRPIGISRTPVDGDTITFTPTTITPVTFELTQDGAVTPGNTAVSFTRLTTGDQLAAFIADAIKTQSITGLNTQTVQANPGGLVSIGGTGGLGLTLNPTSSLIVTGSPDVTGPTTLTIFGPLLLQVPIVGGSGIPDDSQFTLTDGTTTVTFLYNISLTGVANINATPITYQTFEDANAVAAATVAAINASGLNITATNLGNGQISLGAITDNQIAFPPSPAVPAPLSPRRGIVTDGDQVTITQAGVTRIFEFELAVGGGGVTQGAIPVVFQATNSINDIANILAASINNNTANFGIVATALPGGQVRIADTPQTVTTVSNPATISISGTAGGAIPIPFTGSFTAEDIKRSTIDAINGANADSVTSLTAEDRGGATYFIENAVFIDGTLPNYFLEGVKDLAGQLLEPTREDNTTQFTLLLPTIGLDYGDAPDPFGGINGRYPTFLESDGPRHIVSDQVRLGRLIDIDSNGLPNAAANGDDTTIFITGTPSPFFNASVQNGFVEVAFNLPANISTVDGSTITLSTGVDTATLEFDTDGIFNENNFAISVDGSQPVTLAMIAQAFKAAVMESPLRPADVVVPDNIVNNVPVPGNVVRIVTADEDGVVFGSEFNPAGVLNRGIPTPITITVTGGGILEAWIDFNFDGDFNDPGEQIISRESHPIDAVFSANSQGTPVSREFIINVPATTPIPAVATTTYARFRISAEGGLAPTGLALSGEVEDYRLTILPGLPPTINDSNKTLSYNVDEDSILQARDVDSTLTPASPNDDGALAKILDPDGDAVGVFADDIGIRTLLTSSGETAGELTLFADGTFTFVPVPDFFGSTQFTFRATDLKPSNPETQIVSPVAMTVNLTVNPVNDRPFVTGPAPSINRTTNEDTVLSFTSAELTAFYSPGPANEANQAMLIQSAGVNGTGFQTLLGGTLTLVNGNLQYTPPANFPGPGPDRFSYVVADNPNDLNQLVQTAQTLGTVIITINSVNDAPTAGTDLFDAAEDTPLIIAVRSGNGTGILDNDVAGPADEVAANQTVSLIAGDFPKATSRGGTVSLNAAGTQLTYTPPANFSGQDQFTYRIVDNGVPPATASGTVLINVGGDNDAPIFVGVNGVAGVNSLTFNESKEQEQVFTYNLSSWFTDPEGDASTYTVVSTNTNVIRSVVTRDSSTGISTLTVTLPSFSPGTARLNVTATNVGGGPSATAQINVTVLDTADPPRLIGTLNPLATLEDVAVVRNLSTVFSDPDGGQLTYRVTRLGSLLNPTASQIAASPLVQSITFNGDVMTINLDADAFGNVFVEIAASDGTFEVRDSFTLTVASTPDAPRDPQGTDSYDVPVGSRFEIIDPAAGLIGDDIDPDGDVFPGTNTKIRVDLNSLTQPTKGTLSVNANGTFTYTNTSGSSGGTDTFTYRPIDPTGLVGNVVTVTLNLGRSRYQNPLPGFEADVTANGVISPLDALRVINRIAAFQQTNPSSTFFVSTITTAPPDFIDVNGDGIVSPLDALIVINEIARQNRVVLSPEGEQAMLSTTVAYASPTSFGLSESNRVAPLAAESELVVTKAYDPFAAGFDVVDNRVEQSTDELMQLDQASDSTENNTSALDDILSSWTDPINL